MLFIIQKLIIILARTYHSYSSTHDQIANWLKKLPKRTIQRKFFSKAVVGAEFGDSDVEAG